jgi:N-acetylglucosaminyl-diphospho-decaprenol L-rhamnosyltransferase
MYQLAEMSPPAVPEPATRRADLAVVIVSHNDGRWLEKCLTTLFSHAGEITLDAVVVENGDSDDASRVIDALPLPVRLLQTVNGGFAHGNNRGLELTRARYVLFLNPDTEIHEGILADLVARLDECPEVGLAGVPQFTADGTLWPTIRRFPSAARALGEALGSERWPVHPAWAGERVLDPKAYERELECDWTSGSFMIARREALASAGVFDERFFLYCEEPDLCLRIKRAGWKVLHIPTVAIVHHAGKGGVQPKMAAQAAYARRQYALKHFSRFRAGLYLGAHALGHLIRAVAAAGSSEQTTARRRSALWSLRVLLGVSGAPFGAPVTSALAAEPAGRPNGSAARRRKSARDTTV